MADNYVGKLLTELTEKTTATDTDLVPVAEKTGTLFRMTLAKLKEIFLGTKDISGIGDGTVKGAISELNTKIKCVTLTIPVGSINYIIPSDVLPKNAYICGYNLNNPLASSCEIVGITFYDDSYHVILNSAVTDNNASVNVVFFTRL